MLSCVNSPLKINIAFFLNLGASPQSECWNDGTLAPVKQEEVSRGKNNGFWGIDGMVHWENQVDKA